MTQQYVKTPVELLLNTGLTPTSRLVLIYLFWRQGDNQNCWPAVRTIADDLGLSINTVQKSIKRLQKTPHLTIEKPKTLGRGHKNKYFVNLINVSKSDTFRKINVSKIDTISGRKCIKNRRVNVSKSDTELVPVTNTTTAAHIPQKPLCDIPPTEEQVKEYSTTRGFPNFDAKNFIEWYAANDWKHKDGEPVLNWKQTVLTWLRRDQAKEQQAQAAKPEPKRGDIDWLPDEQEAEAIMKEAGL